MIASPLALAAAIAGYTALGLWLEHRFGWARKVGASLLVIASGAVLANAGLVPAASPVDPFDPSLTHQPFHPFAGHADLLAEPELGPNPR